MKCMYINTKKNEMLLLIRIGLETLEIVEHQSERKLGSKEEQLIGDLGMVSSLDLVEIAY